MSEENVVELPQTLPELVQPSEVFPGEVIVSEIRYCDEKYMAETNFRPAFPRPITQWDLRIKAYDKVIQLPDGQRVDAIRYGGYDLEQMRQTYEGGQPTGQWELVPVNIRSNKAALISGTWETVVGNIQPVTKLLGLKAMFEFFPQKRVGRRTASNILLPVTVLSPDYVYTGDVQVIIKRAPEGEEISEGVRTSASSINSALTEEVLVQLPALLAGVDSTQSGALVAAIPPNLRSGELINGLLDGSLIETLIKNGALTKTADGKLATVVAITQ